MKKAILIVLVLLPGLAVGQDFIRYTPAPYFSTFSTPILVPDGTAAAPSISFRDDTNVGFMRTAADTVGFVSNHTSPNITFSGAAAGTKWYDTSASPRIFVYISSPNSGFYMAGDMKVVWRDTDAVGGTNDIVLARSAATLLSVTGKVLLSAFAFAALGTPANGTIAYCSDCTVANPCADSGTGALAKRLAGAWVCN